MPGFDINSTIALYANYFHAMAHDDNTDILNTSTGSVQSTFRPDYEQYDIVNQKIKPLTNNSVLRPDGNTLLVPLEGLLHLPVADPNKKFPLLIIAHGNHQAYFDFDPSTTKPGRDGQGHPIKGVVKFALRTNQVPSYTGYEILQLELAGKGIASYSINLNIVNDLENNEAEAFDQLALDCSQRIQLFFLHLKLLKMIAGEPLFIAAVDEFPIKISQGSTWTDLKTALQNDTISSELRAMKNALTGQIDFSRLGLMGHSRGADTVTRVPAYFSTGASFDKPPFPVHDTVNSRIKKLVGQVGNPTQDFIKAILALEPVAAVKAGANTDAKSQGYVVDNPQTMFFAAVGTHDEDVSFDSVRIYEYPQCSKAMIAINGATHQRFNEAWAANLDENKFDNEGQASLLPLCDHREILVNVFGPCFTSTLGGQTGDLKFFFKKGTFPVTMAKPFYIQMAWKFGFPIQKNTATLNDLVVTGVPQSDPAGENSFKFEQHLTAFYVEKSNEGNFVIKIPIDTAPTLNLSNYTQFSFRFARGYDLSSSPERTEVKNFTIQSFQDNSPVGKLIEGSQISTIELKALRVRHLPTQDETDKKFKFDHSILLQTAEILLEDLCPVADQPRVNRIEITVIPDKTKAAPPSTGDVIFGSLAGAVIGGGIGATGGLIYALADHSVPDTRDKIILGSSVAGVLGGGFLGYKIFKADTNAFVFTDFLLTKRQPIP
jgi:hypothetical protein